MTDAAPSKTHRYLGYGLLIDSSIALPELTEAAETAVATAADVTIRLGRITDSGLPPGDEQTLNWPDADTLWFYIDGVGQFLISDGKTILIDPDAGADPASVRIFLLGSGFGGLLFQRRMLVLHGNSVRIGDACLICVGDSGAGKSTLAAGFLARGYDLLADDVVPVDAEGHAISGFPRIKLWQDTADRLGIDTSSLSRILPDLDKYNLPIPHHRADLRLKVRSIYLLEQAATDTIRLQPVSGMDRMTLLAANTYRFHFLQEPAQLAAHLGQCSRLAAQARLVRVTRPSEGFALDALIDAIVADATGS